MVDRSHGLVEIMLEDTAINRKTGPVGEGKLFDKIATPQFGRAQAELARRQIDQPFQHVIGFGFAGPAIGVDGSHIGENAAHIHRQDRKGIDPAHRRCGGNSGTARTKRGDISADIGNGLDIQCQKSPFVIECQPSPRDIVSPVHARGEIFQPVSRPADRPLQPSGRPEDQRIFRIGDVFHPEPAADIGRHDLDPVLGNPEHGGGQLVADEVDGCGTDNQPIALVCRIPQTDCAARLESDRCNAVVDERQLDMMAGPGKGGFCAYIIATLIDKSPIMGGLIPEARFGRIMGCGRINHRFEHMIVDRDQFQSVLRPGRTIGDNHGDKIADMADTIPTQRITPWHNQFCFGPQRNGGWQGA